MRAIRSLGAWLATVLAVGCMSDRPAESRAAAGQPDVRDSAGVRIVASGAMTTAPWRLGAEPVFTVGWDEAGPTLTWPQSGRILPGGGALIGEFGEGTVYRVGADGSVVGRWGRKGEGPGEFQGLDAIIMRGDSVLVSDGRLRRVTLLSPDGEVRTMRQGGTFLHQASEMLPDGRLLLTPGDGYSGLSETRPEWVFETQPILAADLADGSVDTLVVLPHLRRWYGDRGGSPGPVQVKGRAGGFGNGFVWARSDRTEAGWYDDGGRLTQVARWDEEERPLTSEWRQGLRRILEDAFASRDIEEAFVTAQLARLDEELDRYDGPLPYWDRLYVDRSGNAWLSRYAPPGEVSGAWRVIGRDGVSIGWVELPEVITILDVTDDRILAVRQDELDVPAVVMLDLIKP